MALEIKTQRVKPNVTTTFNFSGQITQSLIGLQGFKLSFGSGTDHHVRDMSINLRANTPGTGVQVTPAATLMDSSGHNLNSDDSYIDVVVIAWTAPNDDGLKFDNETDIQNNGSSAGIAIPGSSPLILQSVLSGFQLSYGSSDHHMQTSGAGVGSKHSGATAYITGSAFMNDSSGHSASTATVNGGLIANSDSSLALQVLTTNNLQDSSQQLTFGAGVTHFQPFLTDFRVQFKSGKDHHLKSISASISTNGSTGPVITVSGGAYLSDNSSNSQDNSVSYISGCVVAF